MAEAAATPAPAAPIPERNLRRFQYKSLGVISDERMSSACLISIDNPHLDIRNSKLFGCMTCQRREKVTVEAFRMRKREGGTGNGPLPDFDSTHFRMRLLARREQFTSPANRIALHFITGQKLEPVAQTVAVANQSP